MESYREIGEFPVTAEGVVTLTLDDLEGVMLKTAGILVPLGTKLLISFLTTKINHGTRSEDFLIKNGVDPELIVL